MYKRKGCTILIIEKKDFEEFIDWTKLGTGGEQRISLKNLTYPCDVNLLDEIDIGLDIDGKLYLGYLDNFRDIIKINNKCVIREVEFYICQDNYLNNIEIIKEVEL